jgi:hypothetical protein
MGNGRPGDHPLTDILEYGTTEFGSEVHALVKRLAAHSKFSRVRADVSKVLMECSPYGRRDEPKDLDAQAIRRLEAIEAQISGGQRESGDS